MIVRIIPNIPKIHAYWNRKYNKVPFLMVPMSDGTVIRYYPAAEQTAFVKALENIRRLKKMTMKENTKR